MDRLPPFASKIQNIKRKKEREKMTIHLLNSTSELHIDIAQNHSACVWGGGGGSQTSI